MRFGGADWFVSCHLCSFNADRLTGQEALVTEAIDTLQAQGTVVVNGQEWSAKTNETDGKIAKGSVVVIDEIQGVKLVVREKED